MDKFKGKCKERHFIPPPTLDWLKHYLHTICFIRDKPFFN